MFYTLGICRQMENQHIKQIFMILNWKFKLRHTTFRPILLTQHGFCPHMLGINDYCQFGWYRARSTRSIAIHSVPPFSLFIVQYVGPYDRHPIPTHTHPDIIHNLLSEFLPFFVIDFIIADSSSKFSSSTWYLSSVFSY